MEEEKGDLPIRPFVDIISMEDVDDEDQKIMDEKLDRSADPKNPNVNDSRRLFQERIINFE